MIPDERQRYLLKLARDCGSQHYDPQTRLCLIPRDTLWYAIALMLSDGVSDHTLGMSLIEEAKNADHTHTPATMIALLNAMSEVLTEKAKVNLRQQVEQSLAGAALVEWNDGNVNHPLGAWCTLICGGGLTGNKWATDMGLRRLKRFRSIIGDRRQSGLRQAEMSEYNSLTYTALNLIFLSLMAEYAMNEEARTLALFLEQQLWLDMAMHYHAPSGQFAGPHSRSYIGDSHGDYSAMHVMWYRIFDNIRLEAEIPIMYNHPSNLLQNAMASIAPLHVPQQAIDMALNKPLPYALRKLTYGESYHENHDTQSFDSEGYPGGWSELVTHMTSAYALGTASIPYVNGAQTDSFILRLKDGETQRSIFARGVYNDSIVGQRNRCHVSQGDIDESYLYEEGRVFTFQKDGRAIVCYHPKRSGHNAVRSFRLDIICSGEVLFHQTKIGTESIEELPVELDMLSTFFFQTDGTFGAIIPLALSPQDSHPMKVWKANGFLIISLMNYNGTQLDISRDEMTAWRNGFVIELASSNEYGIFDEFQTHILQSRFQDDWDGRVRTVRYASGDHQMHLSYDPYAERILSSTFDGKSIEYDGMIVECEGSDAFKPRTLFGREALR